MNARDTSVRQGFDDYVSDNSGSRYHPTTEFWLRNFEAFKRALQARKAQQVQKQQKEESLLQVAKYWATVINNAKMVHDIISVKQWMLNMENNVKKVSRDGKCCWSFKASPKQRSP